MILVSKYHFGYNKGNRDNKEKVMKDTVRVSFDVPLEEHTFLKMECAKSRIALRDLMKEVFHKTVEDLKKKQLHQMLNQGFQDSYEGKGRIIDQEELDKWAKMVDDE